MCVCACVYVCVCQPPLDPSPKILFKLSVEGPTWRQSEVVDGLCCVFGGELFFRFPKGGRKIPELVYTH